MWQLLLAILGSGLAGIIVGLTLVTLAVLAIGYFWFGRPVRLPRNVREQIEEETRERELTERVAASANQASTLTIVKSVKLEWYQFVCHDCGRTFQTPWPGMMCDACHSHNVTNEKI